MTPQKERLHIARLKGAILSSKIDEIVDVLKEVPGALVKSRIKIDDTIPNTDWQYLKGCLGEAKPADALVIFSTMANLLMKGPFAERGGLMKAALHCAPWRVSAIEIHPELFRSFRRVVEVNGKSILPEKQVANAIQILAIADSPEASYGATLEVIHALKNIGIYDRGDYSNGNLCTHFAVRLKNTNCARAFLDEFPEYLSAKNSDKAEPLHIAAYAGQPEVVQMLLERGVNPKPCNVYALSPLNYAVSSGRYDNALVLLDSGAYTEEELREAASSLGSQRIGEAERLHTYLAAVRARQTVGQIAAEDPKSVRAL